MSALTIARETFDDAYIDAEPLLAKHWREIAHFQDIPLEPDVTRYQQAEIYDLLRIYTARIGGKLVGYAVFFIGPNAHYKSSKQAVQDVVYVDPAHRNSTIGLRLLKHCEGALRAEGVQAVYHHVKASHPALGTILGRMGYVPVDVIYTKRLDVETRVGQQTQETAEV